MKTDRELLELAAKAIDGVFHSGFFRKRFSDSHEEWHPLTDDGDALRLAVKLRITVEWSAWTDDLEEVRADDSIEPIDPLINEEYAATRRAIVRAAAAIGEAMP